MLGQGRGSLCMCKAILPIRGGGSYPPQHFRRRHPPPAMCSLILLPSLSLVYLLACLQAKLANYHCLHACDKILHATLFWCTRVPAHWSNITTNVILIHVLSHERFAFVFNFLFCSLPRGFSKTPIGSRGKIQINQRNWHSYDTIRHNVSQLCHIMTLIREQGRILTALILLSKEDQLIQDSKIEKFGSGECQMHPQ